MPKVMAEKRNNKFDPVSRWLKDNNIEHKDFEGIL